MRCAALRPRFGCHWFVVLSLVALSGCAAVPGKRDARDPWERMNRAIYRVNDGLDRALVRPVAVGYKKVVPRPVRTGIANVLDNAAYTTTIANDLLQAKFKAFASDTGRFLLNSTVGLAGLIDVATDAGIAKNDEDFGQTFGRWGIGPGPYVVLPILGPSTLRDALALYPETKTNLKSLPNDVWVDIGLYGLSLLGDRVELLSTDAAVASAFDPYGFVRSAYLQHREYEVRDGDVPETPADEEPVEDDDAEPSGPDSN
jgi:phospholipid-binding lipoprotein MlaA